MNLALYRNCFLVGLTAAAAVGPIFVLVFNRTALYGFRRGFATAVGAAMGDCLLFGLSFVGVLGFLETSKRIVIAMDLFVSILLIFLGVRMLTKTQDYHADKFESREPILITSFKSFLLTVVNPITIFFFMFVSVKVIPETVTHISRLTSLFASVALAMGSLTTLTTVALVARCLHHTLKPKQLRFAGYFTGVIFIALGLYFSFDLIIKILKYFAWL